MSSLGGFMDMEVASQESLGLFYFFLKVSKNSPYFFCIHGRWIQLVLCFKYQFSQKKLNF